MAMPEIPDMKPRIELNIEDVINLLLVSIALEEISLAHIINAEAEKLQEVLGKSCKHDDLMEVNEAVNKAVLTHNFTSPYLEGKSRLKEKTFSR